MSELAPLPDGWVQPAWVQQPFESEDEHNAFNCFKDLPSRLRNLQEVARLCNMTRGDVLKICNAHHWKHRIEQHDAFQANAKVNLLQQRNEDRAGAHLGVIDMGLEVARREYSTLLRRVRALDAQGADVSLLKPSELQAMLRDIIKLERLIRGEATERTEEKFDLSAFTIEELKQWKALTAKASKAAVDNAGKKLDALPL